MYKKLSAVICVLFMSIGCASVEVKAPKEPIKVDISMRLDVYQHVEKDIDAIENMVSGSDKPALRQSWLPKFVKDAYAEDGFSDEVEAAAKRRKARRGEVVQLLASGMAGEGADGMLDARGQDLAAKRVIDAENSDRMAIYRAIAKKNGTSAEDVAKLYSRRLQNDAPAGSMIEAAGGWARK